MGPGVKWRKRTSRKVVSIENEDEAVNKDPTAFVLASHRNYLIVAMSSCNDPKNTSRSEEIKLQLWQVVYKI